LEILTTLSARHWCPSRRVPGYAYRHIDDRRLVDRIALTADQKEAYHRPPAI
jgi:hypothetical protein